MGVILAKLGLSSTLSQDQHFHRFQQSMSVHACGALGSGQSGVIMGVECSALQFGDCRVLLTGLHLRAIMQARHTCTSEHFLHAQPYFSKQATQKRMPLFTVKLDDVVHCQAG